MSRERRLMFAMLLAVNAFILFAIPFSVGFQQAHLDPFSDLRTGLPVLLAMSLFAGAKAHFQNFWELEQTVREH